MLVAQTTCRQILAGQMSVLPVDVGQLSKLMRHILLPVVFCYVSQMLVTSHYEENISSKGFGVLI